METLALILFLCLFNVNSYSLTYPITFANYEGSDSLKINDILFEWDHEIQEINLISDNEFVFVNRPTISCRSWKEYKGKWELKNDTIIFTEQIEIKESDASFLFSTHNEPEYKIKFTTDNNSQLYRKQIKIRFIYDFDSKLNDFTIDKEFDKDFVLTIPFREVPNRHHLASIEYEYLINKGDKRGGYITEHHVLNKKEKELPNNIVVTFIEKPRKEIIKRTTKGIWKENKLVIISTEKSKSNLPDYSEQLYFKKDYTKS